MKGENWRSPRLMIQGALLSAITVIIQASPLYLPVVGISLSALSTLPVAVAAYLNGITGFLAYLISGILLIFWSVPQSLIFLASSGLLGLLLGLLMRRQASFPLLIAVPALALAGGILAVGELLGIPILPWFAGWKRLYLLPAVLACALVYTAVWIPVLAALLYRLRHYF